MESMNNRDAILEALRGALGMKEDKAPEPITREEIAMITLSANGKHLIEGPAKDVAGMLAVMTPMTARALISNMMNVLTHIHPAIASEILACASDVSNPACECDGCRDERKWMDIWRDMYIRSGKAISFGKNAPTIGSLGAELIKESINYAMSKTPGYSVNDDADASTEENSLPGFSSGKQPG